MEGKEAERVIASGPQGGGGGDGCGVGNGGVGGGGGGGGKESLSPTLSLTPSPPPPAPPAAGGSSGSVAVALPATALAMGIGMGGAAIGMGGMEMMLRSGGGGGSSGEINLTRKKRGRPRKYGPDGMALALSPDGSRSSRGRSPGSGKRQLLANLGDWFAYTAGGSFTPHVVTVATGEDVTARIQSFSQKGPRSVCILSANGAISNVTLRQPGSSGGTLTYEGRFEILSLSGSFTIAENGGGHSRTGGISVSLAGPDGRVVGGGVAGSLVAASPIQVVVGSFMPNTLKEQRRKSNPEPPIYPAIQTSAGVLMAARPISQATPADDCETPTSATLAGQNHDDARNIMESNPHLNSPSIKAPGWQGLQSPTEHKPSPDISICLPGE